MNKNNVGSFCVRTIVSLAAIFFITIWVGIFYQWLATKLDDRKYAVPGKLVDIDGYRLHINCIGEGPSVILESGGGLNSLEWTLVQPAIAQFARVCSYDRAGYGWSEQSPLPRTSENIVKELHLLLDKANIPKPYVLVGHSFGGQNVQLFADRYPNDVAGVVLVDSTHENWMKKLIPPKPNWLFIRLKNLLGITRFLKSQWCKDSQELEKFSNLEKEIFIAKELTSPQLQAFIDEYESNEKSLWQLHQNKRWWGNTPLIVIKAGRKSGGIKKEVWDSLQEDLYRRSNNSQLWVAKKSGHMIPFEQPEIIVQAVKEALIVSEHAETFTHKN